MRKKNKSLLKLILGLSFVGSFLFIIPLLSNVLTAVREVVIPRLAESRNQKSYAQINTEKIFQKDKEKLASLKQKQCAANSDDFLYSDCTGFFE